MKLTIVGEYPNKEDTVLSSTTFDTRPGEPILATTEKGTTVIAQPGDESIDLVLRIPHPAVDEEPVVPE